MEIVKRFDGYTLWKGWTANERGGFQAYQVTGDRDGVAVEPSSVNHKTQKAALEAFKEACSL